MTLDVFLHDVPIRRRAESVFDQLRTAIVTGRLPPGHRLPTTRELAAQLALARSTIATVYGRLVAEGYAHGRVGDGTFVADHPTVITPSAPGRRTVATTPSLEASRVWRVDLRAGRPDPRLFPITDWRRATTATLHEPPPGYGDAAGLPELRQVIAAWVARSRGVIATADEVLITAGAQGAFDLCARALVDRGSTVSIEHPGYAPARAAFAACGLVIDDVPVDADGIIVDAIAPHTAMIVVTPSHQSPTGAVLTGHRRRQLIERASQIDALIIEDDYDTEYRYVDRPLEPLQRLDTTGRTIYVGSFSKTLSPSLRLGFIVAPRPIVDRLLDARRIIDVQPPHPTQRTLCTFIATGAFDRHLRRTRRVYRARRDLLVERLSELERTGLIDRFAHCPAGLHTTVAPRDGLDAEPIAAILRAAGIAISTTADNRVDGGPSDLVIGFGLADRDQLTDALGCLTDTLSGSHRRQ